MVAIGMTPPAAAADRGLSVGAIRLLTLTGLLAAYQAISSSGLVFEGAMPGLPAIAVALLRQVADPAFYPHLGRTAYEAAAGVAIGASLGVACGVSLGASRFLAAMLDPWIRALAPAPKIIFLPVLILAFGIDAGPKIAMAAISSFFPVAVATFGGMREVRRILVQVVLSFDASTLQLVRIIYLPSIVVPLLGSLRLAVGVALIGALLAEVKMSNKGLGYLIIQDYNAFRTAEMYALLLLVFALALSINAVLRAIGRRFGVP